VAKSAILFATSQLQKNPSILYCDYNLGTIYINKSENIKVIFIFHKNLSFKI